MVPNQPDEAQRKTGMFQLQAKSRFVFAKFV